MLKIRDGRVVDEIGLGKTNYALGRCRNFSNGKSGCAFLPTQGSHSVHTQQDCSCPAYLTYDQLHVSEHSDMSLALASFDCRSTAR